MGLTIHYQLATTGDEAHSRKLVQQLREAALDLPFRWVGEIAEFRSDQRDGEQRADDDPQRWLLIQADTQIGLPVTPREKREGIRREMNVLPLHIIAVETMPGDGCEPANFGLCKFPSEVSHPEFGKAQTELKDWSWHSFCKMHYASDPRCGGLVNFLRRHLGVVALLDEAQRLGILGQANRTGATVTFLVSASDPNPMGYRPVCCHERRRHAHGGPLVWSRQGEGSSRQKGNDMSTEPAPAKAERRIVIADDSELLPDMMEVLVRDWFREVTVLKFQNRDEAWLELLRRDPDLLITDMRGHNLPEGSGAYGLSGFELLKLPVDRRVKYPVLAVSGSFEKSDYEALPKQCAGPHLNVSFLAKPFTRELFVQKVGRCLGLCGEMCGS